METDGRLSAKLHGETDSQGKAQETQAHRGGPFDKGRPRTARREMVWQDHGFLRAIYQNLHQISPGHVPVEPAVAHQGHEICERIGAEDDPQSEG
jgi:hypothetical protein